MAGTANLLLGRLELWPASLKGLPGGGYVGALTSGFLAPVVTGGHRCRPLSAISGVYPPCTGGFRSCAEAVSVGLGLGPPLPALAEEADAGALGIQGRRGPREPGRRQDVRRQAREAAQRARFGRLAAQGDHQRGREGSGWTWRDRRSPCHLRAPYRVGPSPQSTSR
jgi:hypothetical protein